METDILSLINSKREGSYWDFKEMPHENNASLLHDILSLSNSLHKGPKYLIIGVTDPANDCKIIGLSNGQTNRKTQAQYTDFLRTQKFADDCRPKIALHTIQSNDYEIDVLVISDLPLKPYYLTVSYRDRDKEVRANHIYMRNQDTNTPIDKSADVSMIEKMWHQSFGLDLTPLDKMKLFLKKPNEWTKDIGNSQTFFHNLHPEYTIELSDAESFWEVYSYFFTNEKYFLGDAKFKCHQTELFQLEYMYCDEMRIMLPVPDSEYLRLANSEQWYYYYDLDSLRGLFLYLLSSGQYGLKSRGTGAPFLLFSSESERKRFNAFILEKQDEVDQTVFGFWGTQAKKNMKQTGNETVIDPLFLDKIKQWYDRWNISNV